MWLYLIIGVILAFGLVIYPTITMILFIGTAVFMINRIRNEDKRKEESQDDKH